MTDSGVQTFHFYVGAGDAALVCWLKPAVPPSKFSLKLHRAVLIDGGPGVASSKGEQLSGIGTFLKETLPKKYDCEDPAYPNSLSARLDAIVITHWDTDHWRGIKGIMERDILCTERDTGKLATTLSFCRYDGDVPRTVLYLPYLTRERDWNEPPIDIFAKSNGEAVLRLGGKKPYKSLYTVRFDWQDLVGCNLFQNERPATLQPIPGATIPVVQHCVESLVLSHQSGATADAKTLLHTGRNTIIGVGPEDPCLLVIRAHRRGYEGLPKSSSTSVPSVEDSATESPPLPIGMPEIIPDPNQPGKSAFAKNSASVVCLLIWISSNAPSTFQHYLGGDVVQEQEQKCVDWIMTAQNGGRRSHSVDFMSAKISHHGGNNSSPFDLFDNLNPRYFVVSTGISFGHPRPELLVWLQAWMNQPSPTIPSESTVSYDRRGRRLFSTRYPYYMIAEGSTDTNSAYRKRKNLTDKNFVIDSSNSSDVVAFQQDLITRWRLGSTKLDPITRMAQFRALHAGEKDLNLRQYEFMVDRGLEAWDQIADPIVGTYKIPTEAHTRLRLCRQFICFTAHPTVRYLPVATSDQMVLIHAPLGKDEEKSGHIKIEVSSLPALRGYKYWPSDKAGAPAVPPSSIIALSPTAMEDINEDADTASDDEESDPVDDSLTLNDAGNFVDDTVSIYQPPEAYSTSSAAINATAKMHLLVASTVPATSVPTGYSYEQWRGDLPLDSFLRNLHNMSLAVQLVDAGPDVKLASGSDGDDELLLWLKCAVSADQVVLSRTTTPQPDPWTSLVLNSNILGTDLTFSTSPDCMDKAFGAQHPAIITSSGWYAERGSLIAALDVKTVSSSFTAQELLTFSGVDNSFIDLFAGMSQLPLTFNNDGVHRQAIWFTPSQNYATTMRLQFAINVNDIASWLEKLQFGSSLSSTTADLILKHRMLYVEGTPGVPQSPALRQPKSDFVISMWLGTDETALNFVVVVDNGMLRLMARPSDSCNTVEGMITWIGDHLEVHAEIKTALDHFNQWTDNAFTGLELLRVEMLVSAMSIIEIKIDFLWPLGNVGVESGSAPLVEFLLSLTYDCQTKGFKFEGSLYIPLDVKPKEKVFDPEYEAVFDVARPSNTTATRATQLDIRRIFPDDIATQIPDSLNPWIAEARVELSTSGIMITGMLHGQTQPDPNSPPTSTSTTRGPEPCFTFGDMYVYAGWNWSKGEKQLYLQMVVELDSTYADDVASFEGSLAYNDKVWTLTAGVDTLQLGSLARFFPQDDRDAAMALLKHITISAMDLTYNYDSSATDGSVKDSSFNFEGTLRIDDLELDVTFCRPKADSTALVDDITEPDLSTWSFRASAGLASDAPPTDFLSLLCNVTNDPNLIDEIPSFFNFDITGDNTHIALWLEKVTPATAQQASTIVAVLEVKIDDLSFYLVQMTSGGAEGVKKIIVATLNDLPWSDIPDIPLVGRLEPPFDELQFVYVHDDNKVGLLTADIDIVDQIPNCSGLLVKRSVKGSVQYGPGCHFVVLDTVSQSAGNAGVILSYDFVSPKAASGEKEGAIALRDDDPPSSDPSTSDPPAMSKLGKTQGFLTIANLGLAVVGDDLHVILDATFALGPIEFSLLGFEVDISLKDINLRAIPTIHPRFDLRGMGIALERPPVSLAGIFDDMSTDTPTGHVTKYIGGVVLGFDPYTFTAVGSYSETTVIGQSQYKSVFVFAQLAGPLVELEFAEINDVTVGLGYNSVLRLPAMSEVQSFPFISLGSEDAGDIVAELTYLEGGTNPWIADKDGPIWLAAGMGVKAFQVLDVKAVAVIEFNPFVTIGLVAKAIVALPSTGDSQSVSSTGALLYAELGVVSAIDFHAGSMTTYAKLMPSSFILDPSCHLTGGFALCYWFGDNPHAGDWVFTVGGYHSAFAKPSHYPDVERLGISWDMGGGLSISGQSYFAITPKVCMAGAILQASWEAGPLSAYFDANADFLVVFQPFYFTGHVGVSIGVRFTLDLWFVTLHISVDVGADLDLWGPPFGGTVYVDFYVFGFSISFGSSQSKGEAIPLSEFWKLLMQQPASPQPLDTDVSGINDHMLTAAKGLFGGDTKPNAISDPSTIWRVRAEGFVFVVQSKFAISDCMVTNTNGSSPSPGHGQSFSSPSRVYANPMHLCADSNLDKDEAITSSVKITISATGSDPIDGLFTCTPITKPVPMAIWGGYQSGNDPVQCGNGNADLLDGATDLTVDQVMSISIKAPDPYLSQDTIQPFEVAKAMSADINPPSQTGESTDPTLPAAPTNDLPAWTPAPWPAEQKLADDLGKLAHAWNSVTDSEIQDLAGAIGAAMGWTTIPTVKKPSQLVGGMSDYYMAAPVLAAG